MSEPVHSSPLILVTEERPNWSRRDFIKSVIATGSTVSGLSYFGTGAVRAQTAGVERMLRGESRTAAIAEQAGTLATRGAEPLGRNEYKVVLVENLMKRAVLG